MTKILNLTLKKKWFDLIASGKKKTEYREIKQYWIQRLTNWIWDHKFSEKKFDEVHFRNGYRPDSPFMRVEWKGLVFRTFEGTERFAIKLGKVLEIRR